MKDKDQSNLTIQGESFVQIHPSRNLKVGVLLIGKRLSSGICEFLLVLGHDFGVDLDFRWSQGGSGDEFLNRTNILASIEKNLANTKGGGGVPKSGYRQAYEQATRKASQSCSWTWQRYRSIGGSSCGGM